MYTRILCNRILYINIEMTNYNILVELSNIPVEFKNNE